MIDLEAIEARANASTATEWKAHHYPKEAPQHGYAWIEFAPGTEWGDQHYMYDTSPIEIVDAEFIVHARTDVPALVAEVRALRAMLERFIREAEEIWMASDDMAWDFHTTQIHELAMEIRGALAGDPQP